MKIKNISAVAILASAMFLSACGNNGGGKSGTAVKIWVSEVEGVTELTKTQVERYAKENNLDLNVTIQGVGEGEAASKMLDDVDGGADLFCFAQDQTARLVQGGALSPLGVKASEFVRTNNDAGSVGAVTFGTGDEAKLYAYPLTSDNGIFVYYDKSVLSENDVATLEGMIAACERNNKKISWKLTDIWHSAGFFFGAGCHSEWITDEDGQFISVSDNFNSDRGLLAATAMKRLLDSTAYNGSYNGAQDFDAATPSAVVVSGTWDKTTASNILGENLGAAKLPTFTVNGETIQCGSFSGFKLMGVKPQATTERASLMNGIAQYLTGALCQQERFARFGWGPSNKTVQNSDEIKNDPVLAAFNAQLPFSKAQGNIHGDWWTIGNAIATNLMDAEATEDGIRSVLEVYDTAIHNVFNVTEIVYGVVGTINNWGESPDIVLEETDDPNILRTAEPIEFAAGAEFKIRVNSSWGTNYGQDGVPDGSNYVVETAGSYYVEFNLTTHVATLVAA